MTTLEALKSLKTLVERNQFSFVNRRAAHARTETTALAKIVIAQMTIDDFVRYVEDWGCHGEYLWIFETQFGETYYIKFKFLSNDQVKFISFHISKYAR